MGAITSLILLFLMLTSNPSRSIAAYSTNSWCFFLARVDSKWLESVGLESVNPWLAADPDPVRVCVREQMLSGLLNGCLVTTISVYFLMGKASYSFLYVLIMCLAVL